MNIFDLISSFSRYIQRISDQDVSQMCGLTKGTTSATLKTTNQIVYGVYNKFGLIKAATDNIPMTACAVQPASSFCYYLVSIDALGAVTTTKGMDNTYALPSSPAGNTPIGAFMVTTNSSDVFISGTTNLSSSGLSVTLYDIDAGIAMSLINQAQSRMERGVSVTWNGRQRMVTDFQHMLVRATADVVQGDSVVVLPFPNYKRFVDDALTINDGSTTYPLSRENVMPLGSDFQARPIRIARLPLPETVFTIDGAPAMQFTIWPESDGDYAIDATAYQYSPALDGVIYLNNWLSDNAPDILLFGALVEARSYFPADPRMDEWAGRWNEAVWTLASAQNIEKSSGSQIATNYPETIKSGTAIANKSYIYGFGL